MVDRDVDKLRVLSTDITPLLAAFTVEAAVLILENLGADIGHTQDAIGIGSDRSPDASVRKVEVVGQGDREVGFMRERSTKCVEKGHHHEGDDTGD